MMGFNWVDIIILGLLGLAVYEGVRVGFLTQTLTVTALFVTLFLSGWLFPHLIPFHNETLRTIINTTLVILATSYAALRGFDAGQRLHWSFRIGKRQLNKKTKTTEKYLGILPALAACLALVWLVGVGISRLPFEGFSNSVADSFFVQRLTRTLPPVPAVFAEFDQQIDPNNQPKIMDQPKPYKDFNYSAADAQMAASKVSPSVVRITSFGCGGLVSGSGFVVDNNLVMTNAHVIAGVKRPIVKYAGHSFEGEPILFNAGLDYALLRTENLKAPAAKLSASSPKTDTTVSIIGYPGGNYHAVPGILRDKLDVISRNIYDTGDFPRQAYGIQATTDKGNSGGPIALKDGTVAGMAFSKATDSDDYAYALPSKYLKEAIQQAEKSHYRVSTGACTP